MKGSKANISAQVMRARGERRWAKPDLHSLDSSAASRPEEKSSKIQFHKEGDATNEPGDHDQEGESAMRRGLEEIDVIAQMRIGRENHERIQAAEKQACQESPA